MTFYDRELLDAIRYIGKELRETKKELAEIKKVLQAEKAPTEIVISTEIMTDLEKNYEANEEAEE